MQAFRQRLQDLELHGPKNCQLIRESQPLEDVSRRQQSTAHKSRKIQQRETVGELNKSAEQNLIDQIHHLRLELNEQKDLLRQQNQLLRQQLEKQSHTLSRHGKEHGQFNNQPTSSRDLSSDDDEVERMKLRKQRWRKKIDLNALKKSNENYELFNQKFHQIQCSSTTTFDERKRLAEDQIINLLKYQIKTKALHKERKEKLARASDTQTHLE